MRVDKFKFGEICIDGQTYEHDVILAAGEIKKRKKKLSKKFKEQFGHTPVSVEEKIPWKCQRLIIGTGAYGSLPVMRDVKLEAERRKIELLIMPTAAAIEEVNKEEKKTNAILHVTC